jgi:hypothetical protein
LPLATTAGGLGPDSSRLRSFRFHVSDGTAQFGVLKVLLVEETS